MYWFILNTSLLLSVTQRFPSARLERNDVQPSTLYTWSKLYCVQIAWLLAFYVRYRIDSWCLLMSDAFLCLMPSQVWCLLMSDAFSCCIWPLRLTHTAWYHDIIWMICKKLSPNIHIKNDMVLWFECFSGTTILYWVKLNVPKLNALQYWLLVY